MVLRLFLLRHGKTDLSGRFAGSTDVSLNSMGSAQIQSLRTVLAKEKFDRIFCSPMARCRETAKLLDLDDEISIAEDLREIDFGLWEGKSFAEIEKSDPERLLQWIADPNGFCFPEGECCTAFLERVRQFRMILQDLDSEKILVISHGGVIRHLICSFLGLSFDNYLLFKINEGEFSILDCYSEGGILAGLNIGREYRWEDSSL
jgi:alpha-ribazole phosphatase